MSSEYLNIGPTPADEECQQLGENFDSRKAAIEMKVFKNQLLRQFGNPPDGATIKVKSFPHDYGSYSEVCVVFDTESRAAVEYAYKVESESPANWDDTARTELEFAMLTLEIERQTS